MSVTFTGVYQQDVKLARQLNLFTGVNPKKVVLEGLIADYLSTVSTNTESDVNESQKISEIALLDQLISVCNDSTEKGDLPLLPRPVLKRDRVQKPKPVLKSDRIVTVDPLKRPVSKPIKRVDRVVGPKPKLVKFNRNYFQ
jgi:hypothetical protein